MLVFTTTCNISNTGDILMNKFEIKEIYFYYTKKAMPKTMNYPGKAWKQQALLNAHTSWK